MIVDTVELKYCNITGKVLNCFPDRSRESLSACISNENTGTESAVLLAEELIDLYKSVYKKAPRKTLKFLFKLLLRLINNKDDRFIDIQEHRAIPLKRAALKRVIDNLESLKIIHSYKGQPTKHGSIPPCIRIAYTSEELKTRLKLALDRNLDRKMELV